MNTKFKSVFCLVLALVLMASLFTGCSKEKLSVEYDSRSPSRMIDSTTVAENENYKLIWDKDAKCVLMESKTDNKVWSNIPYDYYKEGGSSVNLNSTINITVANTTNLIWDTIKGYSGAVRDGRIFAHKIRNGIKILYYFDIYKIVIPVEYVLRDDSLLVKIDAKGIIEGDETYALVSVSLAPFLCSTKNAEEDSYLFVPSGSGALMYSKVNADAARVYKGEVFGIDAARMLTEKIEPTDVINLPVFGAKDGNNALLGIIEEFPGSAVIEAEAGNDRTGYASVYPTFYFRGYDIFSQKSYGYGSNDISRISEEISKNSPSVGYYPLSGEEANYNGMAKKYREYLIKKNKIQESKNKQELFSLSFEGAVSVKSSFIGIPTSKLASLTSFLQVEKIVSQVTKDVNITPVVRLNGFGASGITPGEISGEYKMASILGGKSGYKNLMDYLNKEKISSFTSFDVVRFAKSGSGVSKNKNAAKSALHYNAEGYYYDIPYMQPIKTEKFQIIGREKLGDVIEKLIKKTEKLNVSGIDYSTLGYMAYSDYSDSKYYVKSNMDKDVMEYISKTKKAGHSVSVVNPNSYAACAADVLFNVPMEDGNFNSLDVSIPFYQMVFRGIRPMYSTPINTEGNFNEEILLAVTSGIGLNFTVIDNFDTNFDNKLHNKLYSMLYQDNKDSIRSAVKDYENLFNAIKDSEIVSYDILENNISKTVFDNGIVIYGNHSNQKVSSPVGDLEPFGFGFINQ